MTPTIVCRDGQAVMVTGSPGGRTIINTVLCVLVNAIDYGMSPRECVDAPRHHHAWWPDRIQMEEGVMRGRSAVLDSLRAMGHAIDATPRRQGDAHSIFWDAKARAWVGVEDRRRSGGVAGFGSR
jgi:gamma-glutamyltranspeptidase/glutathione hydrolase